MTFREFEEKFFAFPVISVAEVEKAFPGFDRNALTRWQGKGYLEKIRQGYYRLTSRLLTGDADRFIVANRIYHPSYVSLQSAMRWYDFIPEGVFTVTSITTLKTTSFETPIGAFQYRNLKKELFFGYRLEKSGEFHFKIADPEKTMLDFLHLHPDAGNEDGLHELRLNVFELKEKINWEKMERYLSLFASKALKGRVELLKKFMMNHDVTD